MTTTSLLCQNTYPKVAVINNDTVALLRVEQVKYINTIQVKLDDCIQDRAFFQMLSDSGDVYNGYLNQELSKKQTELVKCNKRIIGLEAELAKPSCVKQETEIAMLKKQRTEERIAGGAFLVIVLILGFIF